MKIVYLDVAGKMHSLYKELINNPPSDYKVVTNNKGWDNTSKLLSKNKPLFYLQERVASKLVPVNLLKARLESLKNIPENTALTYSTGHLVFRKEPWVVDLEYVTQLTGYNLNHFLHYYNLVKTVLSSEYCKGIICWTEACKRTVLESLVDEQISQKVELVPLAVPKKQFTKEYENKDRIKLLFVGSVNITGQFEINGGKELLEAYILLKNKYHNIELIIRSDIPDAIKAKYYGIEGLTIIDKIMPWQELEREFKTADIFVFPAHTTPGMVFLDAMSYELPVITTDVWANSEMVKDGENGLIVKKSAKVKYYSENFIPKFSHQPGSAFMNSISSVDYNVVQDLADKIVILIENPDLRKRMGKTGRQEIENGIFSIVQRNLKLKIIFDGATS